MFGLPGGGIAIYSRGGAVNAYNLLSTFFDGTDDFVDLGTPADLTINLATTEFSVGAWINVTDISVNRYIFAKALPFVPEIGYAFGVGTTGQLFGYFGHTTNTATANSLIAVNTWYHVGYNVALNARSYYWLFMD